MSADAERDQSHAARWRELELEARGVARAMIDPEVKGHMLFLSESHGVLAKRAELRKQRLAAVAKAKRKPVSIDQRLAKVPAKVPNSLKRRLRFPGHRLPCSGSVSCSNGSLWICGHAFSLW